ncbi:unnamed protein product [Nippostrongylus brasiliensis]|uniref:Bestrophin homolog n=1 Tax=Nippostrongylus brasiliensis TaxID=27835 RepID=A0A0N4Y4Y8_NIPBR|nr:unnamed protein product [Nippostrongylus brasiliensis]
MFEFVSIIYRFAMNKWQRQSFEALVDFTNARLSYIPLDLMLGFFVAGVLRRFWYLYNIIGFMENIALMTALYVRGTSTRARQYRRNIVRYCQLTQEVRKFRTDLAWLCNYDWVPLPMIYPTIVCLAVHTYFLVGVIARQYIENSTVETDMIDMVFPFMTSIQFVLYMGWLKVAEALLNPWGEDDDDFETNVLIDRNLAMGLKIVDDGYGKTPELRKDAFWDDEWGRNYEQVKKKFIHQIFVEDQFPRRRSKAMDALESSGSMAEINVAEPEEVLDAMRPPNSAETARKAELKFSYSS